MRLASRRDSTVLPRRWHGQSNQPDLRRQFDQRVDHSVQKRITAAVAGVVDDLQPAGGPGLGQPPSGLEGTADVVATAYEHGGNPGQRRRLAKKLTLPQKGGVAPVMSDQTGKSEAEFGIVVAWVGLVVG